MNTPSPTTFFVIPLMWNNVFQERLLHKKEVLRSNPTRLLADSFFSDGHSDKCLVITQSRTVWQRQGGEEGETTCAALMSHFHHNLPS